MSLFDLTGKVALVTGGTGALGSEMALGLAAAGARVAVMGRREQRARQVAERIEAAGGEALVLPADVLDRRSLQEANDALLRSWGRVDILVNAAGGNRPAATVGPDDSLFDLDPDAVRSVVDLNLLGTLQPILVFGRSMAESGAGSIVNISSMAAQKPLTRVVGYSAAKAGIENLTRWLAVQVARECGPGVRVNAIAPGFFIGEQNRNLLLAEDGSLTERGRQIVEHTPMGRFGRAEELVGSLVWLCSDAAQFVTGVVVPVDGGYSAFGGV